MKHGKILSVTATKKWLQNTIWVLVYSDNRGSLRFLGSYPSHEEAEQAGREEFSHRRIDVVGFDPLMVGIAWGGR